MIGHIGPRRTLIRRHSWKWIAGIVLVTGAVAWWIYHEVVSQNFDWGVLTASIASLRWSWVLLSLIPLYGTYYGRALRWAVFLKPLKPEPVMWNLVSATVIGFTAITLFGRPGEFIRPYLIAVKERLPVTSQLAAWLLERLFDLLMALLLFGFALAQADASRLPVGSKLTFVLAVGGKVVGFTSVVLLILLISFRHFAEPARRRITDALRFLPEPKFVRFERVLTAFVQGIESTRSDTALLLLFLYSVLEWLLIAASFWCVAEAFSGIPLTVVDIFILIGFVSFGAVFQVPGIGGGVQIVCILVLTQLFGVRLERATAFAFVIWFLTFVAIVPVGLVLALKEGLDWHNLRQIGREAAK
ncbi:MAG TPA: lysylphosphatidylglycerol synthase transmembrane domain-containing protein [Bryobacteraceae bacterium]|nr:lysylphosphatidylglycerol synthase transmembrane domain-containing protein [Bryobacteraceae bacterium]